MVNLHYDVLEFVTRTDRWRSLQELVEDFSALAARHGFPIFILTGLPSKNLDVEPLVIANHWPVEWSDRYREQVYFPDDPVSKWSLTLRRPFRWREAQRTAATTKRTLQIAGEACDAGLVDGLAFPLRDKTGIAVISLASDVTLRPDKRTEASLFLAASYFRIAAERLCRPTPGLPRLTAREREVLTWAASGKSAWETAQILSTAENTVKSQLRSIRAKLEVSTTAQAAAAALSSGEIQL